MGKLGPTIFETSTAQPAEEFAVSIDFFSRLKTSETLSSVAVKAFDKLGVDKSGDILNGAVVIQTGRSANSEALQNVHNLIDGERYDIQMLATTSAGTPQILEADIYIPVKQISTT